MFESLGRHAGEPQSLGFGGLPESRFPPFREEPDPWFFEDDEDDWIEEDE